MKKAAAIILAVLFVLMAWKIGWCQAFLFYAGALSLLVLGAVGLYAWQFHKQDEREKWEDEP